MLILIGLLHGSFSIYCSCYCNFISLYNIYIICNICNVIDCKWLINLQIILNIVFASMEFYVLILSNQSLKSNQTQVNY